MIKFINTLIVNHIYFTTAFLSFVISLLIFSSEDIIGRDAVLYINVAQGFLDGGLSGAYKIWGWPFYSIIIALIHKLTSLSLEHSAHLLTMLMELIISITFVKIYEKISVDNSRLWVAMLFIISFSFFNDYKGGIFRGYSFWAFSLIALYQFIIYFQTGTKLSAILWQCSIFMATLFRPEGIIFAICAPLYFIFTPQSLFRDKFKKLITLYSLFLIAILGFLISLSLSSQLLSLISNNLPDQISYFSPKFLFYNFNLAVDNFSKYVLPFEYSVNYTPLILASGLLVMLIYKLVKNFTLVYTVIWLIGYFKKWIKLKQESYIVTYFISISLLILVVFIGSRLFVSSRYLIFVLLLMGLIFSQYLDYLIKYLYQKNRALLVLLGLFILFGFLDSVTSFGAKKTPVKQSSLWLSQNLLVGEKTACNEERFVFYTQQDCLIFVEKNTINKNQSTHYTQNECKQLKNCGLVDFIFEDSYNDEDIQYLRNNRYTHLILWVNHKNIKMLKALEQDKNLILLKRFGNSRKDLALVFKIKDKK